MKSCWHKFSMLTVVLFQSNNVHESKVVNYDLCSDMQAVSESVV